MRVRAAPAAMARGDTPVALGVAVLAAAVLIAVILTVAGCARRPAPPRLVKLTRVPPRITSEPALDRPGDPRQLLAAGETLPPLAFEVRPADWSEEKDPPFPRDPFARVWKAALPLPAAVPPPRGSQGAGRFPGPPAGHLEVRRNGHPVPSRAEATRGGAPAGWVADRDTLWILTRDAGAMPPGPVQVRYDADPAALRDPLASLHTGDPAVEPSRWRIPTGSVDAVGLPVPGEAVWTLAPPPGAVLRMGFWARARGAVVDGDTMRLVEDPGEGIVLTALVGDAVVETRRIPAAWIDERVHSIRIPLPASPREDASLTIRLAVAGAGGPVEVLLVDPRIEVGPSGETSRLGVVLVVLDTLRRDRLGCYGCPRETSPAIDAWSRGGTRFRQAMANANWTLPSHVSLFLSQLPHQHRVWTYNDALRRPAPTLARELGDRGIVTAAFTDGGWLRSVCGLDQGFGEYHDERRGAAGIFQAAAAWIRSRGPAPFFLFVHTYEVHGPYAAPLETLRSIDPGYDGPEDARQIYDSILAARERRGEEPGGTGAGEAAPPAPHFTPRQIEEIARQGVPGGGVFSDEQEDWLRALYEGGVRVADQAFRELLGALREEGLEDQVLVILTSDHGESLGEHRIWGHKRSYYEGELAIPLLLRGPGIPRGAVRDDVVSLVDLAPTILAWWGLPPLAGGVGRSLLEGPLARPAVASGPGRRAGRIEYAVREGRWKLLRTRFDVDRERQRIATLHDLGRDPEERDDLSGSHEEVLGRLKARFDDTRTGEAASERAVRETLDPTVREELRALGYAGG